MSSMASAELWTAAMAAAADRYTMEVLGMPSAVLMERAALSVCAVVEQLADARGETRIGVLVGPGNNGADGLAVARLLHGRGRPVWAVMVSSRHNQAVEEQLALARAYGVELRTSVPTGLPAGDHIIVDALLGTGSHGAPRGAVARALEWLEALPRDSLRVVAVDLPSGIEVDSGAVMGRVARADATVSFERSKVGLHLTPARACVGVLSVAEIGLVADPRGHAAARLELIDPRELAQALAKLPTPGHKGKRGHVGVIGGTGGTPGAAILAGSAALRVGAGLVTLASLDPEVRRELVAVRPELMLAAPEDNWRITPADVLVVGPGLVKADPAALLRLEREDPRPMVWDASALEHMTQAAPAGPRVLTPHPGEAARMLALADPEGEWTSAKVQGDRRKAALRLAAVTRAVVVLKGAGSLVAWDGRAAGDGAGERLAVCTTGGPALASAGTGDVLAGAIAALLARGLSPWWAACVGVHVHGLAGDRCLLDGTVAMDVADALAPCLAAVKTTGADGGAQTSRWPRRLLS